ncbi:hypothetical protein BGZ65_012267, partial [Modicella reniformis]
MADTKVEGLDREKLHEPLSSYLNAMKGISDPYLVYQVAYAYQALQCVPDDETLWQATLRRSGKVIKGVSGLVSAVKGLDISGFIEGLKDIQKGLGGATEVIQLVVSVFAETLLQELKLNADTNQQALMQKDSNTYPLKVGLPALGTPSLLDRVQNKPDVETSLRQLRKQRLKVQGDAVYIHPQAKASLQSPDDEWFPLKEKVEEFLSSNQKVFLLLGDSGA